jgi:DNA-binding protein Fis
MDYIKAPFKDAQTERYLAGLLDYLGSNELPAQGIAFYDVVGVVERFLLEYAKEIHPDNKKHGADFLGIHRTTYLAMLKRLGLA